MNSRSGSRSLALSALVCVVAAMMSACGEIGDPYLGAVPSTSSTVVEVAAPELGDQPTPVTVKEAQAPPRPEGYVAPVLLSGPVNVLVGEPDDVTSLGPPVQGVSPRLVTDDYFGGLVVESQAGQVLWFPAEGGEAALINDLGGSLLGVGFHEGTPEAILSGEENAIDRVQLVTGERLQLAELAEDRTLVDFSASAGLFGILFADQNCGGMMFLNSVGEEVDLSRPAVPANCPARQQTAYGQLALAPDADAYAYTEVAYRSDGVEAMTELVGWEILTGAEVFRIKVGEPGSKIHSLSFDGRRVAFLRTSLDQDEVGEFVVVDTANPELDIPVVSARVTSVGFARLPVTVGIASE